MILRGGINEGIEVQELNDGSGRLMPARSWARSMPRPSDLEVDEVIAAWSKPYTNYPGHFEWARGTWLDHRPFVGPHRPVIPWRYK